MRSDLKPKIFPSGLTSLSQYEFYHIAILFFFFGLNEDAQMIFPVKPNASSGPITSMRSALIQDLSSYGCPRTSRAGRYESYGNVRCNRAGNPTAKQRK